MPRFNANLSMLFTEVDFLDRFARAAEAGFEGVEYLFPYAFPAQAIRQRLDEHQLTQVLFNLPAGNWEAGDRGIAADPARVNEFREGVDQAIEYARALGCQQCNALAGIVKDPEQLAVARETFIENLRYAAAKFQSAGLRLLIEAINTRDIPGFFLHNSAQAIDIMDEVDSSNLMFQYDIYHMQIMEGDLAMTMSRLIDRIGHIQLADNPGRHEPGSGEIHYPFLFRHLEQIGYQGWVGCEYIPLTTTEQGLGWLQDQGLE